MAILLSTFASRAANTNILNTLDAKIGERDKYLAEKDSRINELKFDLENSTDNSSRARLSHKLFNEYKTFQYDSAYVYALKVRDFAVAGSDDLAQAYCDLLYCYSTAGFFKEGADIIKEFPSDKASQHMQANFYRGAIRYYFNLMRFVGDAAELKTLYRTEMLRYTALALENLQESSFTYNFVDVQSQILLYPEQEDNIEQVTKLLATPNLSLNNKAILYSWLGMCYNADGNMEKAIYYTALSAISDIESCTYETTSARELATYMYESGDIARASKYINLALIDANTYNVPYRKLEIQSIMPTISGGHISLIEKEKQFIERQRHMLITVSTIIIVLLVVIVVTLIILHRRNAELKRARREQERHAEELADMNEQLSTLNGDLSEANKIKDKYIIESLYSDTEFVDTVEKMCRVLVRKINAKQYTELVDLIGGLSIKRERQRMSSTFDAAFLKLFPNFIDEYNKLFDAESSVVLSPTRELSPEIRIFALIRLGIEDVNLISKYLNLSLNTVYVYKAKVKARTIVPKDEFEEYIKAIKQPY